MPNRRNPRRNSQAFTVAHNCTSSVPIRNQITSIRFVSLNAHRWIKITTHNLLISHLNLKVGCSSSSPSSSSTVNNLLTVQVHRILILLQHRMTQTHSSAHQKGSFFMSVLDFLSNEPASLEYNYMSPVHIEP